MATSKSDVVSLMLLLRKVLCDLEDWCSTSTIRDYKTIAERVEHEGLPFLTITLANFGKDFEKCLDQGFVTPDSFLSFKKRACLPRFLGGFTERVFDRTTGRLLDQASELHIQAIRQITLMWAKINIPCSDTRNAAALDAYVKCELELTEFEKTVDQTLMSRFTRVSNLLWSDVFHVINRKIDAGDIRPKHGSGATADRLSGNRKWDQQEWTTRLESEFPSSDFLISSHRYWKDLSTVTFREPGDERPVRVIHVPKTQKTPRIIAMEPACMMYVQLGLLALVSEAIEADDIASKLIGWRSSEPNQLLAAKGSRDGSLATLDLSEASDRVTSSHVRALLGHNSSFFSAVMACRSQKAKVPGRGVIPLTKFASMGSALTFPIESMVFMTVIFMGIESELNRQLTYKDIKSFVGKVRVYGDDIIVPVDFVASVQRTLEDFNFKVNVDKSFWTGKFRESCGKEYFNGHDVTIVKVRDLFPTHRRHSSELESIVSLRNHFYTYGFWKTASHLDNLIGRLIPFPRVAETSPVLGRHSFLGYDTQRTHASRHSPLVKGVVVKSPLPVSRLDGHSALLKCLVTGGDLPNPDLKHLERAGRPRSSFTKTGWFSPF